LKDRAINEQWTEPPAPQPLEERRLVSGSPRKRTILLGAGASAEAGVPVATEMTKQLHDLSTQGIMEVDVEILRFVAAGILFRKGARGDSPFGGVDIEELLNALSLLADRDELEVTAFVGAWHPRVDALDRAQGLEPALMRLETEIVHSVGDALEKSLVGGPGSSSVSREIDRALEKTLASSFGSRSGGISASSISSIGSRIVAHVEEKLRNVAGQMRVRHGPGRGRVSGAVRHALIEAQRSGEGKSFRDLQRRLTKYLSHLAWIRDPIKVQYLKPILGELSRQGRLVVASLNYDNAIELLCSEAAVKAYVGVDDWTWTSEVTLPDCGLSLLKLHGSVDWTLDESQEAGVSTHRMRIVAPAEVSKATHLPAVVFGGRSKLRADGPFLDLFAAFRRELASTDDLVIVGYSFRDEHINEYIGNWLSGSESRTITIIDLHATSIDSEFASKLMALGAKRVLVLEGAASAGLAEVLQS
jgi:hypothetical protein